MLLDGSREMYAKAKSYIIGSPRSKFDNIHWKQALESAGQGVWDYNIKTDKAVYSNTWYKMRGLRPCSTKREADKEWLHCIHPEDVEHARVNHSKLMAGQLTEVSFEYRERHEEGHWIWIMCRGKSVAWDASGKPSRVIGTDTDITTFKASEARIRAVSKRLELTLSSVQIGVWQYNIKNGSIEWDERLRSIYGLANDDEPLPPDVWEQALHPEDRERARQTVLQGSIGQTDYDLNYRIVRPDGAIRHIRSRVSFHEDSLDGPMLIGIDWDVTEEHNHSSALEAANRLASIRNAELESARAKMEHDSLHDSLTGLPNRRKLDQVQRNRCSQSIRLKERFAVLHIDLDRFKQINDVFGHISGDLVLRRTAKILKSCAGSDNLVSRVGGDEFVIFIPDAPPDADLTKLAEQIIFRVSRPFRLRDQQCRYGASIGIAVAEGGEIDGKALFINADLALYRAKHTGRGRVCIFTTSMKSAATAHKRRCDELLSGLERNEFFCVYQPQFKATSLHVSGIEALVRWNHPEYGVICPSEFLKIAAELDVLAELDRVALQRAVADFNLWKSKGFAAPRLSVNVSGPRLSSIGLQGELASLDIDLRKLSFELLESNFLDEVPNNVMKNLSAIRNLGVGIEVDDFGTGFTSIVGLLRLKPDRLKIDKALVAPIAKSEVQVQLLKSIVEIGQMQGISIIAEGVENTEQMEVLRSIGCDELQGFALARPISSSEMLQFLSRSKDQPA